ncbi:MAG: cellulase family glycosylhydrolase [Victivallales bacterium]|jgi:endo-1,4-beta-mannosidase|nr:cellulase family glycosylhydrolase [Victivallales bacterium]
MLFNASKFFTGCNYWASHAGTYMWRNWNAEIVENDLQILSRYHLHILRIFPLWSDFQPLTMHYGYAGAKTEMRFKEEPLPDTEPGRAGLDETMLKRFGEFLDIAERNNFKLIVGLVTGWMSGRLYAPEAFANLNVITDAAVVKWQVKMVRYIVKHFRHHPAIIAWDLGNECNCLAPVASSEEAYSWSAQIANAIHAEDQTRPVVSGMHSLACYSDSGNPWLIEDQGETTDILCTHPYPAFNPLANMERVNTFKNAFHAVAETRLYENIGRKPAFIEEAGTLGPCMTSDAISGAYLNNMLWNAYAHDCHGLLWWCANEQTELPQTPYDWVALERELGLLNSQQQPKPVLSAMKRFAEIIAPLELPLHRIDAVVLPTRNQDAWASSYGAFLLAKQAGFDIEFALAGHKLADRSLYIMPSITGATPIYKRDYDAILQKVSAGATLFVSSDTGIMEPMNRIFGVELQYREMANDDVRFELDGTVFSLRPKTRLHYRAAGCEVLISDQNGELVLSSMQYGKGKLILCTLPIETLMVNTLRAFMPESPAIYSIYRKVAKLAGINRFATRNNAQVTLTEHVQGDKLILIAVNNSPESQTVSLAVNESWHYAGTSYGDESLNGVITIPANDATVLNFKR